MAPAPLSFQGFLQLPGEPSLVEVLEFVGSRPSCRVAALTKLSLPRERAKRGTSRASSSHGRRGCHFSEDLESFQWKLFMVQYCSHFGISSYSVALVVPEKESNNPAFEHYCSVNSAGHPDPMALQVAVHVLDRKWPHMTARSARQALCVLHRMRASMRNQSLPLG
ncbi:uncharacterized protein PITG_17006 [Phytophthora infestans T30-4]|uniref:Uncharacterized protein n=2 Tax=Phytophthora infestans TaxID=4787 RepID=D0NUK5_PHYIT|nr:uncharacterized protein PITG_17006 [Phytophthora infestans T30-4]EEY65351.1 hypothetical protein PITG_17006 [Phytophthora infestans T30-4]KAF4127589.1 hypothetical protein GN958_ATG23218 [Phytophthora infestans]|eukprot:XP_002897214.1 hypothetical protein PITG_17006 [Phytophthora infestans T30-4]